MDEKEIEALLVSFRDSGLNEDVSKLIINCDKFKLLKCMSYLLDYQGADCGMSEVADSLEEILDVELEAVYHNGGSAIVILKKVDSHGRPY
jgi:hypothetical protein